MSYKGKITKTDIYIVLLALADVLFGFVVVATGTTYISAIFSVLILISGVWMLLATVKSCRKLIASKQWVSTPYEVIETKFTWHMGGAHRTTKFVPYFKIQYNFGGVTFTRSSTDGFNLSLFPVFSTNKAAHEYLTAVRNFKYGTFVFVNPEEPSVGYLRTGIGRGQYGALLFSIILIALPVLTYAEIIHWQ